MRAIASLAVLCSAAWLALNLWGNYGGHISGLFYTGAKVALPAELDGSRTRRVRGDDIGYDAQYYRLAAHDPLLRRGFAAFADNPSLRWRRIGIPALAALLSMGDEDAVDGLFVAIQLVFVFAGAFWLARYAEGLGRSPAWGLAFLLIPATAISLDRMTIDLPLAALTIGLALYGADPRRYLILIAAPLVRETGMVLTVAWCLWSAARRDWREAMRSAACGIPAGLWWIYVRQHTPPDTTPWLATYPFSGIVNHIFENVGEGVGPTTTLWLRAAAALEWVALAGVILALLLALGFAVKRQFGVLDTAAIVFAIFAAALGKTDIWGSAYAFGRTMSPLLVLLGLVALRDRKPYLFLPILLILPRIALQYEAQLALAIRG